MQSKEGLMLGDSDGIFCRRSFSSLVGDMLGVDVTSDDELGKTLVDSLIGVLQKEQANGQPSRIIRPFL